MKIFAVDNFHMALLDLRSLVTAVRRAELLSSLRSVDNELIVFEINKGLKIESVGHLGTIINLTNIIFSVYEFIPTTQL